MGGMKALRAVWPAAAVCGIAFAGAQFYSSNYIGPYLTDILASLCAIGGLVGLMRIWKPKDAVQATPHRHTHGNVILAWMPYVWLVVFVSLWGATDIKAILNHTTVVFPWPGLHELVLRMPPITAAPAKYGATYTLNLLSASGTSCLFAVFASAAVLRVSPGKLMQWTWLTARQLALPMLTIATVVGLAFLMNYSGATATLGLAFAATGAMFPFFSSLLGWLGVFLTGSDTSANALFGTLQVITANRLGLNPALMAAANSSGGVMGKMISLTSVAVAAAATGMKRDEEGRLFRFTLKHSIFMATVVGLITMFYAYAMPGWVK
jgi:L-lactate permease